MTAWIPIDENTPRDRLVLCMRDGWDEPALLRWKCNYRIVWSHERTPGSDPHLAEEYFGDPNEDDDYELATEAARATHWHPFSPWPAVEGG